MGKTINRSLLTVSRRTVMDKSTKGSMALILVAYIVIWLVIYNLWQPGSYLERQLRGIGFYASIHPTQVLRYDRIKEWMDVDNYYIYLFNDDDAQKLMNFIITKKWSQCPMPEKILESWLCDTEYHKRISEMLSVTNGYWTLHESRRLFVYDAD